MKRKGGLAAPASAEPRSTRRIKERGFAIIDELRAENAGKDPEKIDRDVMTAVEAVRQEMYDQRQRATPKNGR